VNFVQNIKRALTDGNFGHRWERLRLLSKIEFKLRYYESKLGLIWALINPVFRVAIFYVVFKLVMNSSIENYALYLFSGIVIFQFFSESTTGLLPILKSKQYLYEYSNMSKFEIYLSNIMSITIGLGFNLMVCLIAIVLSGIDLSINILWIPLIYLPLAGISLGIGMIISNLMIVLKDMKQIWPMISQVLFWISPIFFKGDKVEKALPLLPYFNPIAGPITTFRNIMFYHSPPDFNLLAFNYLHAIVFLGIGLFLLNKIGKKASELL
jgi:ABC-type polysaccharide/polyol phosphate export permease